MCTQDEQDRILAMERYELRREILNRGFENSDTLLKK